MYETWCHGTCDAGKKPSSFQRKSSKYLFFEFLSTVFFLLFCFCQSFTDWIVYERSTQQQNRIYRSHVNGAIFLNYRFSMKTKRNKNNEKHPEKGFWWVAIKRGRETKSLMRVDRFRSIKFQLIWIISWLRDLSIFWKIRV